MTPVETPHSRESPADRWIPWLLAVGAAAYLLPLRRYGLMILDDGWYLQPVMRMQTGELLYRDVWTFYAPGIHHVLEWLFTVTGTSILAARTLWVVLIAVTAVLSYRFARRFAPAWIAWLPAATYLLVPGPWHKSYYATLTIAFFVLLARAFERAGAMRFAALGACAGIALVTRQDLGLAALGIGLVAAPLPALLPDGFGLGGPRSPRHAAVWIGALLGAFAIPVAVTATYYALHGALPQLIEATFARAFAQAEAHRPLSEALRALLSPAKFAMTGEGRFVGALMLLPLVLYPALAAVLVRRVLRDGVTRENALLGALLGFAVATLPQAYRPMLLLRFLQSALPCYLLATIAVAQATLWLRSRGAANGARALTAAAFASAALLVGQVIFGLPAVAQPIYTGSARVLRYTQPVDVLGERFYEGYGVAEEIRLVRAFFAAHAAPDEPTLGLPTHTLYNALLERPNPTRYLCDHPAGDFVMTAGQKSAEAERLLASPTRFVLVDSAWYAHAPRPDPLLAALRAEFHPVRGFGTLLILERGNDPTWANFATRLRAALTRGPNAADIEPWRRFAAEHPDEPLAWRMVGTVLQAGGDPSGAIAALERASALDPTDPAPLEGIAQIDVRQGRVAEARATIARAREVRDSPTLQRLSAALDAPGAR